jgi:hypothetical protein
MSSTETTANTAETNESNNKIDNATKLLINKNITPSQFAAIIDSSLPETATFKQIQDYLATRIDVRGAVETARNYLRQVLDQLVESGNLIQGLRLEETELSDDNQYWLITLGFDRPVGEHLDPLQAVVNNKKYEREYRIFKIDAQTGKVQSMKIREL